MVLKTIATGSSGNCHALISSTGEILLLDLGVTEKTIKKGIDWKISSVVGAVVTHQHIDHSLAIKDFKAMGIPVFIPAVDLDRIEAAEETMLGEQMGSFRIKAFQVPHNGTRNCGFLIYVDGQKFLYMTDYEYSPYNFAKQKINHMLIECNYIKDMADTDIPNFEHKIRGHAELDTVRKFVEVNNSDALQSVILCHLGNGSSDKDKIITQIKKIAAGATVDVAEPGKCWELKNPGECPF